jgi:hypothetical protein
MRHSVPRMPHWVPQVARIVCPQEIVIFHHSSP